MSLGYWETLITQEGDGAAITVASRTSLLLAASKKTLPPNFFDALSKRLIIKASGRISSVITTPGTARFDVSIGGTVVWDSLAILLDTVAGHTNVGWDLDIRLVCRVKGSAAQLWGRGTWTCEDLLGTPATAPKGCLTAILPWNTTPAIGAAFDGMLANVVDLSYTQTAATGSMQLHEYELISPN